MQEMIFNIFYVVIIVMLAVVLGYDVIKKRKLRNSSMKEEEELPETLAELPSDQFIVLKDINVMTKLGKSRTDYIIVSLYGIFCLEFRAFYILIGGSEYSRKWKKSMKIMRHDFTSPLWTAKIHNLAIKDALAKAGLEEKPNMRYFAIAGFPNCADPSYCDIEETTSFAGKTDELVPWMESWDNEEPVYTKEEMEQVAQAISQYSEEVPNMESPNLSKIQETGLPEEYKAFTLYEDDNEYKEAQKEKELVRFIEEEKAEAEAEAAEEVAEEAEQEKK